jgi:hypothetical protein
LLAGQFGAARSLHEAASNKFGRRAGRGEDVTPGLARKRSARIREGFLRALLFSLAALLGRPKAFDAAWVDDNAQMTQSA